MKKYNNSDTIFQLAKKINICNSILGRQLLNFYNDIDKIIITKIMLDNNKYLLNCLN